MLRELLFSLFGITWVISKTVRETLLSWKCFFKDEKWKKKVWKVEPPCLFLAVWKIWNEIAFRDDLLSMQKLKISCLSFLVGD